MCDAGWFFFSRVKPATGEDKESQQTTSTANRHGVAHGSLRRVHRRTTARHGGKRGKWRVSGDDGYLPPLKLPEGANGETNCTPVGWRKILVYYTANSESKRTDWVMHEYRLEEEMQQVRYGTTA